MTSEKSWSSSSTRTPQGIISEWQDSCGAALYRTAIWEAGGGRRLVTGGGVVLSRRAGVGVRCTMKHETKKNFCD